MSEFSSYRMGPGRAFRLGAQAEADSTHTPVVKRWETIEGRTVLFEQIEWSGCEAMLAALPRQAQAESGTEPVGRVASLERRLPERRTVAQTLIEPSPGGGRRLEPAGADIHRSPASSRRLKPATTAGDDTRNLTGPGRGSSDPLQPQPTLATSSLDGSNRPIGMDQVSAVDPAAAGVVLDYELLLSQDDFTFAGDKTYYVTGTVQLTGTTTLEGGTVVKFDPFASSVRINVSGPLVCKTGPYRPAIFTARDDHSVGEPIGSGSLDGYYGAYALYFNDLQSGIDLRHVRIRHVYRGVGGVGNPALRLRHAQIVDCQVGVYVNSVGAVDLENVLVANVGSGGRALYGFWSTVNGRHLTVHGAPELHNPDNLTLNLWNSLLVAVTTIGPYGGGSNAVEPSDNAVFGTVGAGAHYLPLDSVHRNQGTDSIGAELLGEMRTLTTEAPAQWGGLVNTDVVLGRRVARDDDGAPDRGYHYAPLDYVLSQVSLQHATLVLTNGVAVGSYGSVGVHLQNGAVVVSEGAPQALNRLIASSLVQEGSSGSATTLFSVTAEHATLPEVQLRFTEVSVPAAGLLLENWSDYQLGQMVLRDCRISSARLHLSLYPYTGETRVMVVALTNNIF
ncbi:MAG: hypothetical protein FJ387_31275, partial [Verrucomicrobia bacterium]|nr:hypothetical protein [Verrucomicrobiota bacterium]